MPPSLPPLNLNTAATAANEANFRTGAKTFGPPSLLGEISQQVVIGIAVAIALAFIIPRLKKS